MFGFQSTSFPSNEGPVITLQNTIFCSPGIGKQFSSVCLYALSNEHQTGVFNNKKTSKKLLLGQWADKRWAEHCIYYFPWRHLHWHWMTGCLPSDVHLHPETQAPLTFHLTNNSAHSNTKSVSTFFSWTIGIHTKPTETSNIFSLSLVTEINWYLPAVSISHLALDGTRASNYILWLKHIEMFSPWLLNIPVTSNMNLSRGPHNICWDFE